MPEPSSERLVKDVNRVLNNLFWIPTLQAEKWYTRLHDDHDGTKQGVLGVYFTPDGDVHVVVDKSDALRFRFPLGGGNSQRTRTALMILAEAIRQDQEDRPDGT